MFFVDDDESEAIEGGKDSAAGADDDTGVFLMNFMPFIEAFALAKVAMEHGDLLLDGGEAAFKAFHGLGCERDFGDEDKGGLVEIEDLLDGLEVYLGFSTAGYAVEEEGFGRGRGGDAEDVLRD